MFFPELLFHRPVTSSNFPASQCVGTVPAIGALFRRGDPPNCGQSCGRALMLRAAALSVALAWSGGRWALGCGAFCANEIATIPKHTPITVMTEIAMGILREHRQTRAQRWISFIWTR